MHSERLHVQGVGLVFLCKKFPFTLQFQKLYVYLSRTNTVIMAKITVKDAEIKTIKVNGTDYICITDIARQKNPVEPKDVVKNWFRSKNTLEYLGLWEMLNNPDFKGVEFDPLL